MTVYNKEINNTEDLPVEEGTVLIDNSHLGDHHTRRERFIVCHELDYCYYTKTIFNKQKPVKLP